MKTIRECLSEHKNIFYRDKEFILQHIVKKERTELYTLNRHLTDLEMTQYSLFCQKYQEGYPLAYLLKETDFYGHRLNIEPGVFIPRIDTETLVDSVIRSYSSFEEKEFNLIDFGCGSGCVGLSLLLYFKKAHLFSVDISLKALNLARKNAQELGVEKRVSFLNASVNDLCVHDFPPISLIVANPPYIDKEDPEMSESVKKYEPHEALFSEDKGRKHIQQWLEKGRCFFQNHPSLQGYFFEIGYDQYKYVSQLLKNDFVEYIRDSHKIYRVVYLKRNS